MTAFYNEHDPYAAQYLRNLIAAGAIAPGVVDTRDIQEIEAWELTEFTQVHMFAGIGIWSGALRAAGWPDDEPIWTGSCPCQPFSNAGQKKGFSDDRHLWPFWHSLIAQCRPARIAGEQVASKDGKIWLDIVSTDLEALDIAFGAADLCAAGFGGAHIRQREYFAGLADNNNNARLQGWAGMPKCGNQLSIGPRSLDDGLGNAVLHGDRAIAGNHNSSEKEIIRNDRNSSRPRLAGEPTGSIGGMSYSNGGDASAERQQRSGEYGQQPENDRIGRMGNTANGDGRRGKCGAEAGIGTDDEWRRRLADTNPRGANPSIRREGKTLSSYWHDVDWILCRNPAGEPSWRPVEPGTFPLANGIADRVGKLRAYGNALDFETAKGFCEILVEICLGL